MKPVSPVKTQPPSDLELQVLAVLWRRGALTARDVREALPDGKHRAYTTVLSVLQVMEKKGLVSHTVSGQANVYRPEVTRRQALGPLLRAMVRNVFGGSAAEAVVSLVSENDVSAEEMAEIRRLLDERETPVTPPTPRRGRTR